MRDTGIGISSAALAKLFRSFSQVQHVSGEYGGTGLGLVISKRLVEAMGGEVTVESAPGQGSTFAFTIRCEAAEPAPGALQSDADVFGLTARELAELRATRLLFVGPRHAMVDSWLRVLESYHASVHVCASGTEARAWLKQASDSTLPLPVVIADVDACNVDAGQSCSELLKDGSALKALLVSANAAAGRSTATIRHLRRPFKLAALLRAVLDIHQALQSTALEPVMVETSAQRADVIRSASLEGMNAQRQSCPSSSTTRSMASGRIQSIAVACPLHILLAEVRATRVAAYRGSAGRAALTSELMWCVLPSVCAAVVFVLRTIQSTRR